MTDSEYCYPNAREPVEDNRDNDEDSLRNDTDDLDETNPEVLELDQGPI